MPPISIVKLTHYCPVNLAMASIGVDFRSISFGVDLTLDGLLRFRGVRSKRRRANGPSCRNIRYIVDSDATLTC